MNVKGYIRVGGRKGAFSDLQLFPENSQVEFSIMDARRAQVAKGIVKTNKYGSFAHSFALPDNLNLGRC